MAGLQPQQIKTISEYHQTMGLPKPEHPLISVISFDDHRRSYEGNYGTWVFDFYTIAQSEILPVRLNTASRSMILMRAL